MRLTQIDAEGYASGEPDETPRRFNVEGQPARAGRRGRPAARGGARTPEWPRAVDLKVRAVNQREYLRKQDLEAEDWLPGQQE